MLHDASRRTKVELALDTLRQRICMAHPTRELLLHEGALADEFGMSRTPIRQVLQRLAYERLVETKSGVGTVATPMDPVNRPRDLLTHQGILRAIRQHPLDDLTITQHSDVVSLAAIVESADEVDGALHFEVRSRLLTVLCGQIDDPVLRDAFLAAHWRVIRWHMLDFSLNAEAATSALRNLISKIAAYRQKSAQDLFLKALDEDLSP